MSTNLFEEIKNIITKSQIQQHEIEEAIKLAKQKCSGKTIEESTSLTEISQDLRQRYVQKAARENLKSAITRLGQSVTMSDNEWKESGEKISKRNARVEKELNRPVSEELFTEDELAKIEEIAKMIDENSTSPFEDMLALAKKISPNARKRPSVEDQKQERDELIKTRKIQSGVNPPIPDKPRKEAYPLGGYDPKSNRSYSD